MTRCHHVGTAAPKVGALYMPVFDQVDDWDDVRDRPCPTPSLASKAVPGAIVYPQVLPCIEHLTVAATVPYYKKVVR